MKSLPRSIPPSLRETKRNPLVILGCPVDDHRFACSTYIGCFLAVTAVTLLRNAGYGGPFDLVYIPGKT